MIDEKNADIRNRHKRQYGQRHAQGIKKNGTNPKDDENYNEKIGIRLLPLLSRGNLLILTLESYQHTAIGFHNRFFEKTVYLVDRSLYIESNTYHIFLMTFLNHAFGFPFLHIHQVGKEQAPIAYIDLRMGEMLHIE